VRPFGPRTGGGLACFTAPIIGGRTARCGIGATNRHRAPGYRRRIGQFRQPIRRSRVL